jgi:anhydro-N-acetylmuramic acid kinase
VSATPLYLGLISGTSADGIDAALLALDPHPHLLAALTHPYPESLRGRLLALISRRQPAATPDELGELDARVGLCFAEAALALLARAEVPAAAVRAIGSHGQTLSHRPGGDPPHTWQIGDPARIVERTGITTVADFRRRDVAAGGQGAPLVPAFHAACFRNPREERAVLNLGGIANLTVLPSDPAAPVLGFDCGPGNALLDEWIERQRGQPCDRGGDWAASGRIDEELLATLLADPFFADPPPKSTGREYFNLGWAEERYPGLLALDPADVQATLLELTARSVVSALLAHAPSTRRILVCGGGVHNRRLIARLAALLAPRRIESTAMHGIDPDFVEAAAFAWLAAATVAGRPGNLPEVTGAHGPRILGAIYPA